MSDNYVVPEHVIRAAYSERTIRVYQAYSREIAIPALVAGRFVPPFSMGRMTWIKPSFNWMMYRSGYASKPGQEFVLGIDISREGFLWALRHSVHSSYRPELNSSYEGWQRDIKAKPVRVQWDPERDWRLQQVVGTKAIQIGLSSEAVERYVNEWTFCIVDVTPIVRIAAAAAANNDALPVLPSSFERPYPLDASTAEAIFARQDSQVGL